MKLLFDENFSRKLVSRLDDLYPEPRTRPWALREGHRPLLKVIWLREWTHPTKDAESVLRSEAIRIAEFARDPELGLLIPEKV